MEAPFGLNTFTNDLDQTFHSYVVSFDDADIDLKIQQYLEFLNRLEQLCQSVVEKNLRVWGSRVSYQTLQFKSCLKLFNEVTPLMRLKLTPNVTELYDYQNTLCAFDQVDKLITKHSQIISLLELKNIWINSCEFGLTWKVIQIKVYQSIYVLGEGTSLLNDELSQEVQGTPPQPMEVVPMLGVNPRLGLFASINAGGFQLKRTQNVENVQSTTSSSELTIESATSPSSNPISELRRLKLFKSHVLQPKVSLDEILQIRKNLRPPQT